MSSQVEMTKDGGFYYRAVTVHWTLTLLFLPLFVVNLILAVINPFWFRESMMSWTERTALKFARWRDRIKYRVYLGTDPTVWHALKDLK